MNDSQRRAMFAKLKKPSNFHKLSNRELSDQLYKASFIDKPDDTVRVNLNKEAGKRNKSDVGWWRN